MRGCVRHQASGDEVMRTRSPRLAIVVARLLNGEDVPRLSADDPSPLARYNVGRDPRNDRRWVVYPAESTVQHPSAFGDGIIAVSADPSLAGRMVVMLNEIDPESRRRPRRGFGWW